LYGGLDGQGIVGTPSWIDEATKSKRGLCLKLGAHPQKDRIAFKADFGVTRGTVRDQIQAVHLGRVVYFDPFACYAVGQQISVCRGQSEDQASEIYEK
jgi:hypothetical protein